MREIDPDARLMLAFGGGDAAAFDKLFERWKGPLLRYLDRIVHDAATAEELVQEAFLRVHRARDHYVADAKFSTWLYRIATNLAFNELRRPVHRHRHASTDAPEGPTEIRTPQPGPDEIAHARLLGEMVGVELGHLPERQRVALWLCAVEGLSYREIAEVLETTEKSVKALVHRARAKLAERMSERGAEV
ncbi:MAG: RNA polymerase sigma factor [Myxococcota bacterium]